MRETFKTTPERFGPHAISCVVRAVLCGLDYLHNQVSAVHADVKPANILITFTASGEGLEPTARAKVSDLGSVVSASSSDRKVIKRSLGLRRRLGYSDTN